MNMDSILRVGILFPVMWIFLFLFYTFSFEINRLLHTIVIVDRQRSPGNNKTVNTN